MSKMLQNSPSKSFIRITRHHGITSIKTHHGSLLVAFLTIFQKVIPPSFIFSEKSMINLSFKLLGDIICVFSQYGEIVNVNLIRDKKTGKQKGFCFLCYEDQRSTILAVDNLNGIKVRFITINISESTSWKFLN